MSQLKSTGISQRIGSLDFLRGIAILGILLINAENFAYPDAWSPWKYGFKTSLDHSVRFWVYFFTQGKCYSMFALLFGVGFYMFLERLDKKQLGLVAMDIYSRRLLWLFVIGILHAYLIWEGDVLYHYAICGLLLFPFRSIKTKSLLVVIGLLAILQFSTAYNTVLKRKSWKDNYNIALKIPEYQRSEKNTKQIKFWENRTRKGTSDTTKVEAKKQSYLIGLQETLNNAKVHKGMVYYQGLLFRTLILMLLGIVLYRSGVFRDYQKWPYYWAITISVLCVGLLINYLRYFHWTYEYFNPVTELWKEWLFTFPKEILGLAYVLLFNGLYQKFFKNRKQRWISNIGRTALSNYIFQNTVLGLIFYGYGLGLFNQISRFELLGIVLAIWIIEIGLSLLWLKKYNQGPLEYIWRKLTYKDFQKKPK